MEKYSQSLWDVCHAFIQGWVIHACQKLHLPLHVIQCDICYGTQHGTLLGVPTPLSTRDKQSWKDPNKSYATNFHTMHASPLKVVGTLYRIQSQSYENTTYQAHSQGYGKMLLLVAQTPR